MKKQHLKYKYFILYIKYIERRERGREREKHYLERCIDQLHALRLGIELPGAQDNALTT